MAEQKPAGDTGSTARAAPSLARGANLAVLSLVIALVSLMAAVFQGYINARNLAVVQRDLARREHVRACKEAAELFFEAKLRIARHAGQVRDNQGGDGFDAALATGRLAAVSTYLANFGDGATRNSYTALSQAMRTLLDGAAQGRRDDPALVEADRLFGLLNADCVRAARLD
ncbi:MAG: hypothetical protein ACRCUX_11135 [Beijerinckiaceae bacterium]